MSFLFDSRFRNSCILIFMFMLFSQGYARNPLKIQSVNTEKPLIRCQTRLTQTVSIEIADRSVAFEVDLFSDAQVEIKGVSMIESDTVLVLGTFVGALEVQGQKLRTYRSTMFTAGFDLSGRLLWIRALDSVQPRPDLETHNTFEFQPITENEAPLEDPDDHGPKR